MFLAEKEITFEIKKPEILFLLAFLTLFFIFTLRTTIKTPINFGDEGFHTRAAQWFGVNRDFFAWFPYTGGNMIKSAFGRPPLWNLTQAAFYMIFGFHELFGKILPPLIGFFTGLAVYLLVKQLYGKETGLLAAIITVSLPAFVTYSVLLYTDTLMTFYFSICVFSLFLYNKTGETKYLWLSAAFAGFSLLTKMPALAAYLLFFMIFLREVFLKKKFLETFKKFLIPAIIMIVIPAGFFVRSIYYYHTPLCGTPFPFVKEVCEIRNFEEEMKFTQRTEQTGTEIGVFQMGLVNYLTFAYGPLWFSFFAFIGGLILLLNRRDKIDEVLLMALSTLFILILFQPNTLIRAEDTSRYTLGWIPIIAVFAGRYFAEVYFFLKKYLKVFSIVVFVFVAIFGFLLIREKATGMIPIKNFSPLYFQACEWIKQNTPKDSLIMTVWSSRAVYNCQRNVIGNVADIALSTDLNYTLNKAKAIGITHIFVQKFSMSNEPMSEKYSVAFVQFLESNPNSFEKIYENGPPLIQCLQQGGCDGNIVYKVKY